METLRLGSTGHDVAEWQKFLGLPADGLFGPKTEEATKRFQEAHGLTPDGVVGLKTWIQFHPKEGTNVGFVENRMTPLDPNTAAQALSQGFKNTTGSKPDKTTLGLLLGQVALETANFRSIHNFNFGNVRGTAPDGGWTSFTAGEIVGGKEVILPPGENNKFRAYPDAISGATDYIKVLRGRPNWWNGLLSKSPEGFIKGLTTYPAYFTASPSLYLSVLEQRMALYKPYADKYGATALGVAVGAALAAGAGFLAAKKIRES